MSDVYLRDNPPVRSQYRSPRRSTPTGLTVLHTAESIMDAVGPDTGAENVAAFIQRRREPGSYHDLVDSDSNLQLVRYGDEAYQDGTGSNPFALSISFACRTTDWPKMSSDRREAFLRQGALAFARQQAWLASYGYPTTPLRRVSRTQSERGEAGFISHGTRDPGRRSDPGRDFPWNEWVLACLSVTTPAPPTPAPTLEDDMAFLFIHDGAWWLRDAGQTVYVPSMEDVRALIDLGAVDASKKLSGPFCARLATGATR